MLVDLCKNLTDKYVSKPTHEISVLEKLALFLMICPYGDEN